MRRNCDVCNKFIEIVNPNLSRYLPPVCSLACFKNFVESLSFEPISMIKLKRATQEFRSGWEASFANILKSLNIPFEYEQYVLENEVFYLPDFYIPKRNIFFEIKGIFRPYDKARFKYYANKYERQFWLINKSLLELLSEY